MPKISQVNKDLYRMWVFYAPQNKNKMGRMSRWEMELTYYANAQKEKEKEW